MYQVLADTKIDHINMLKLIQLSVNFQIIQAQHSPKQFR